MKKTSRRICLKRFLSLGLSLLLVLTLLPAAAFAVETYTTSEEGIALIKEYEDFRSMPYNDNGLWYIGYGTLCDPADYPGGVTEQEADALMREALSLFEDIVNQMLMEHNISVTQYQFDAMIDMTYNLGTQWIGEDYRFCSYLIDGIWQYSEAEVVNAIATWCHRGTTVLENLVHRRLRDAYLFLYGVYDNDGPEAYTYIHFDPAGGTMSNLTVFYPVDAPYGTLPEPVQEGHVFQGWVTTAGHVPLTGEEIAEGPLYATARWDSTEEETPETPPDYTAWVNPYSDVREKDWFYTYVRELSSKSVVGGYPDGTFQAEKELTAGEALKLILMAVGYPDPGNASSGHWAGNYLELAETLGCLYSGEVTDLDGPLSRQTIARVAAVAMDLQPRIGLPPFADVDDGYVLALFEEGILNGTISEGKRWFYPQDGITRGEMCAIVSRISGWEYTVKNDPAQSGIIQYGKKEVAVLPDVPAAPYDKNLFVLDGGRMYYNDPAYTTEIGIDVARYQGSIDWEKVAQAGIDFAIIRLGGRFAGSGEFYDDANFQTNMEGALAAGIKVGVYFYSTAITKEEAVEEAEYVLERIRPYTLTYPVVYDWEILSDTSRNAKASRETVTECTLAFCQRIEQEWYTPMIYMGLEVGYNRLDLSRLTDYDFWFAQYTSRNRPDMYYNFRIWQYSDKGVVPGIEEKVDMDIALIPYNR